MSASTRPIPRRINAHSAGLRVEDLELAYGDHPVLAGVSLEVEPGEFVGLIGPNASGKSTLLKAVTRVLPPVSGRVTVDGSDVWREMSLLETARTVAVVPQDFPVSFPFTVWETVLMGRTPYVGRLKGEQPRDKSVARAAMEATGTISLADRTLTELAGGERQRVVLAKALAQEPRLLLLDEPTSHLDISHQVEILDLLLRLNRREGLTVLIVLHDLNLASIYCDRLYLISGGKLVAEGPPEQVLAPANLEKAYGSKVLVGRHPVYGCPQVTLVSQLRAASNDRRPAVETDKRDQSETANSSAAPSVHVVLGGGSSGDLLESLVAAGYAVTAGPVNAGDSDWQVGRALGVDLVTCPPFSSFDSQALRRAAEALRRADVVVVGPVPFGRGNVAILESVKEAARRGRPVGLVRGGRDDVAGRDFTDGRATALAVQLAGLGATILQGEREALAWMAEVIPEAARGGQRLGSAGRSEDREWKDDDR